MEQKIKIIIADKNEDIRESLREYLETHGTQTVYEASTKEELITGILANETPEEKQKRLEADVAKTLHFLGISANIKGYLYLRTSILLTIENPNEMSVVTKALYPTVAKIYGTTPSCVERAMRHAISTAWECGDLSALKLYFSNTVKNSRGKPTNSEFIAMIAEHIKMKFDI